jgi:hypothetical protein
MDIVGEEEIEAIAKVIRSGKLFRYGDEGQCATFERRYAAYLVLTISHCPRAEHSLLLPA